MKRIGITLAATLVAACAWGQGQINFNNRVSGVIFAPVYRADPANSTVRVSGNATTNGGTANYTGHSPVTGTNFIASLWYANQATPTAFTQIQTTPFRTSATLVGIWAAPLNAATVPAPDGGGVGNTTQVMLQVRVWDNRGGTINSWSEALAAQQADPSLELGYSDPFLSAALQNSPPSAINIVGFTSFSLTNNVPEPSVIALGALALGALLLRRRKSNS